METDESDPRFMRYNIESTKGKAEERRGVLHLVQGWIQQKQPEKVSITFVPICWHYCSTAFSQKGLFLSAEFTRSGIGLGAIRCWYRVTRPLALMLATIFKELFPKEYEEFKEAFEAGVWLEEDPGPWLGRAIIYKLNGLIHVDTNDKSPSVSFPCGKYTGGEMMVPQLDAKFR